MWPRPPGPPHGPVINAGLGRACGGSLCARELQGVRHEGIGRQQVGGVTPGPTAVPEQPRQHPLGVLQTHALRLGHTALLSAA